MNTGSQKYNKLIKDTDIKSDTVSNNAKITKPHTLSQRIRWDKFVRRATAMITTKTPITISATLVVKTRKTKRQNQRQRKGD